MANSPVRTGLVLRVDHGGRTVLLDPADGSAVDPMRGERMRCTTRGTLKRSMRRDGRHRVVVGDRVTIALQPSGGGVIEALAPRETKLGRRAAGEAQREQVTAANIDRIVCVVAVQDPMFKRGFVDRVLCAAERTGVPAALVLNKIDLVGAEERDELKAIVPAYEQIDVPVLFTSASTGEGVDALKALMHGQSTAVTGPSGVGKSSLLNAVQPGLGLATRQVSQLTGKGKHTTTAIEMFPLEGGGYLVDTPGVRSFGFYDLTPRELGWLFKDLRRYAYYDGEEDSPRCRFHDCQHVTEPGCQVHVALDAGELDPSRYDSYRRILDSLDKVTGRRRGP